MPTWKSRGLRGSALEDMINYTIEQYSTKKLALIQKIPTPIKPINIDQETRHITHAYFDQKSTVDYIAQFRAFPICFDAKESVVDTFPLEIFHEHQVKFMQAMEEQKRNCFYSALYYTHRPRKRYYMCRFPDIVYFWNRGKNGGRKSFTYDEIDKTIVDSNKNGVFLHFLEQLQLDLLRHADESNGNGT